MGDFYDTVTDTVRASAAQAASTVQTNSLRTTDARQIIALVDVTDFTTGPLDVTFQISDDKDGAGTWYPAPNTGTLNITATGQYSIALGSDASTGGSMTLAPGARTRLQGVVTAGSVTWSAKLMRSI